MALPVAPADSDIALIGGIRMQYALATQSWENDRNGGILRASMTTQNILNATATIITAYGAPSAKTLQGTFAGGIYTVGALDAGNMRVYATMVFGGFAGVAITNAVLLIRHRRGGSVIASTRNAYSTSLNNQAAQLSTSQEWLVIAGDEIYVEFTQTTGGTRVFNTLGLTIARGG